MKNMPDGRLLSLSSAGQPEWRLEGAWHAPEGDMPFPAVVVAHPHPLWGGTMHNPVVVQIAHTLAARGWGALRVNFRGVGSSQGQYDEGRGEIDDLTGALDWLAARPEVDAGRLAVVGYSFGAWVAARVAVRDARIQAYVGVALPMSEPYAVDLSACEASKCLISGARDTLSPPELLRQYVRTLADPKTLHVIPEADHLLQGYEREVAGWVADFLNGV